jgi:CRP-like cAMP-binding protein
MADELLKGWKTALFKKGSYIFRQNESSRELYILKKGHVKVFKMEGEIEIEFESAGPGEVVGECAALDGGTRSATVMAMEDTEAFVVSPEDFSKIIIQMPDWIKKISVILVQRLREVDSKIDYRMSNDKTPHAAALISFMTYSNLAEASGTGFEIPEKAVSNELMDILNLTPQDAVEIIDHLQKQKLLTLEHSKIVISDREKLDQYGALIFNSSEETPST